MEFFVGGPEGAAHRGVALDAEKNLWLHENCDCQNDRPAVFLAHNVHAAVEKTTLPHY